MILGVFFTLNSMAVFVFFNWLSFSSYMHLKMERCIKAKCYSTWLTSVILRIIISKGSSKFPVQHIMKTKWFDDFTRRNQCFHTRCVLIRIPNWSKMIRVWQDTRFFFDRVILSFWFHNMLCKKLRVSFLHDCSSQYNRWSCEIALRFDACFRLLIHITRKRESTDENEHRHWIQREKYIQNHLLSFLLNLVCWVVIIFTYRISLILYQ